MAIEKTNKFGVGSGIKGIFGNDENDYTATADEVNTKVGEALAKSISALRKGVDAAVDAARSSFNAQNAGPVDLGNTPPIEDVNIDADAGSNNGTMTGFRNNQNGGDIVSITFSPGNLAGGKVGGGYSNA